MSEDELWPGTVGITVRVPHVDTPGGRKLMGATQRKPWVAQLERCAKHQHESARAVLQDETTDWAGTSQADAVLWCSADVDIASMRSYLHREGYFGQHGQLLLRNLRLPDVTLCSRR